MKEVELISSAWYGDKAKKIRFPISWDVKVVGDEFYPTLNDEEIKTAFIHPISSPPISDLAPGKNRVAILVDDITRPTPAAILIPHILQELRVAGVQDEAITIIIAGGSHRPATKDEIIKKIGSIPSTINVFGHDCKQNLEYLGESPRGTPIFVNEEVLKCDLKIGVGCIYPHASAGFSGGSKIIMPGVCGLETSMYAHKTLQKAKTRGEFSQTDFRREIEDIAQRVGLDFIVNVVLNQARQITGLFVGDRILAHQKGVEFATKLYSVRVIEDADIVITDVYPFDVYFNFAFNRGLWNVLGAKRNTTTIAIAACPMGIGHHELYTLALSSLRERAIRKLKNFQIQDLYYPIKQIKKITSHFQTKKERRGELMVLSEGITSEELKSIFPEGKLYQSWDELLPEIENRFRKPPVKVAVYRCAPLLLPTGL